MNPKFSHAFLKEYIDKANRSISVVKGYVQNVKAVPITPKFYSKYNESDFMKDEKFSIYTKLYEDYVKNGPKEKYSEPICESHNYGWQSSFPVVYDERDRRILFHPRHFNEVTIMGEKLAQEKCTERERHYGMKFKLVV